MAVIDKPRKLLLPDTNYTGSLIPDLQPPAFSSLSAVGSGVCYGSPTRLIPSHSLKRWRDLPKVDQPTSALEVEWDSGSRALKPLSDGVVLSPWRWTTSFRERMCECAYVHLRTSVESS